MRTNNIIVRALLFMFLLLVLINTQAQTGLNFQGVARNSNNIILASQQISLRLSILQGSASGVVEYTETRKVTTNAQGLFAAVIGESGAINTLGNFTTINWKNTPKYLKIEMDVTAGTNFVSIGTTQFQSVAYAQFANSVDAANIAGIVPVEKGGTGVASITTLKTALAIDKINNTTDAEKPISTKTQAALDLILVTATDTSRFSSRINAKANASDVATSLALKEDVTNKSAAADLGGVSPSDILFPTQKAVKAYVTANSASGGVADGGITNIKLEDGAVTYAKFQSIPTNTILGNTTSSTAVVQAIATTGSDNVVLSTSPLINSPTLVTPNLGIATATSLNNITMTAAGGNPAILSVIGTASVKRENNGDDAPNQRYENLLTDAVSLTTSQPIDGQKTFQNNLVMGNVGGLAGTSSPTTINFFNGSMLGDIQNIHEDDPDIVGSIDLYAPDGAKWVQLNYADRNYIGLGSNRAFIEVGGENWKFKSDGSTELPGDLNFTNNHAINFTSSGTSTPTSNASINATGPFFKIQTREATEDELDDDDVDYGVELNYADRNYLELLDYMYFVNHDDDNSNEKYWSAATFGYGSFNFLINNNLSQYSWDFKDDGSTVLPGALLLTGNIETAGTLKLGSTIFTKDPGANGYVLTYLNGNAVWQASTGTGVSDNIEASTLSGTTLNSTITGSSLTSVGTLANLTVIDAIVGSITGNAATATTATTASTAGTASTATKLSTARNINGVAFDGSEDITITASADAGTLTGTTLKSTITGSSLTSVGTLTNLTVTNSILGSIIGNAATVTTNANLTGVVTSVGNITSIASGTISNSMLANSAVANLSGTNTGDNAVNSNYSSLISNATHTGDATGSTALTVVKINGTSLAGLGTGILKNTTGTGIPSIAVAIDFPTLNQSTTGNAATVTTNANLTGVVTSVGNITSIASGTISNSMLVNSAVANLSGTNTGDNAVNSNYSSLISNATHTGDATGSTALTVVKINGTSLAGLGTGILKNTTGTGVPSIAVASDFPILNQSTSGNAATATKLTTSRSINGVAFNGTADITIAAAANAETLAGNNINATITGSSLTSVGILNNATINGKVIVGASSAASASAVLEASSTTQGFLPPRMTLEQRIAITSPAQGLMIYCTNCGANGEPEYFNGSSWLTFGGNATAKAIPTVNITVGTYTYTGSTQGPSAATNTGTGSIYTYSYIGTGSTTYSTNVTRPTNAGTYSVTAIVSASPDGNYAASSSSAVFTIAKAIPTVTPTISTYTYSLSSPVAQGPSAATKTGTGTISNTYIYAGTGFTTYGPSSTKPTDGGNYTVIANVSASSDGNYAAASSSPTAFKIALNLSLGDSYGGGKVAYILKSEDIGYDPLQQHGLIISGNLIVSEIIWGTNGSSIGAIGGSDYYTPSGTSTYLELGAGINNTNLIIAAEGPGTTYAAGLAKAYLGGGYTNWYLPSFSELYGISSKGLNLGAITHNYHWTSTEGPNTLNALVVTLGSWDVNLEQEKVSALAGVRAVRVF